MKRVILLFLSLLAITSLAGCATSSELPAEASPTQQIITTSPTLEPTSVPTKQPTLEATSTATPTPTETPAPDTTVEPTTNSTPKPTTTIVATPVPTQEAMPKPTVKPTAEPTAQPTVKPTVKPTQKPSGTPKPTVVQKANINTGISWDGKSAIIYTYPDGSTGTEKRVGAKYEAYPGVIYTVEKTDVVTTTAPPTASFNPVCSYCSKTQGNGTNGTCVRWLMGDVDCPNCGEHVQVRTCHTCKGTTPTPDVIHCSYCGRIGKDGTNGTCLRYWTGGDHICKNCGATVPVKTCHTCK